MTQDKNVHLQHLEELIFDGGVAGARDSINFLRSLRDMLSGTSSSPVTLTTKFDGAPAIIAGVNPENGKFFVGTKGVFAGTPKLNYTDADIDKNHPSPGLNSKLKTALRYLPQLGFQNILQGDMMFTHDSLEKKEIHGETYLTFTPNTITYAIPYDSDLAKRMRSARVGIVFHTKYVGPTIKDLKATYNPDVYKLRPTGDVWFRDASFVDASGSATFTETDTERLTEVLKQAGLLFQRMNSRVLNQIAVNETYRTQIKAWNNQKIRSGQPFGDSKAHVAGLLKWVTDRLNADIVAAKQPQTKTKREQVKNVIVNFYTHNFNDLVNIFEMLRYLLIAKNMIIRKLQTVQGLGTFIRTTDGFRATQPEGFVAIDRVGSAVKLVDRLEFSHANFTVAKNWTEDVVFPQECLLFESPASEKGRNMGLKYLGFGYWGQSDKATYRENPQKTDLQKLQKTVEVTPSQKEKNLKTPVSHGGLKKLVAMHKHEGIGWKEVKKNWKGEKPPKGVQKAYGDKYEQKVKSIGNIGSINADLDALTSYTKELNNKLSKKEKDSLRHYCSDGYEYVNGLLRDPKALGRFEKHKEDYEKKKKDLDDQYKEITAQQKALMKQEPGGHGVPYSDRAYMSWENKMDDLSTKMDALEDKKSQLEYSMDDWSDDADAMDNVKYLDSAFAKAALPTDLTLYRGLTGHRGNDKVGDVVTLNTFVSTSMNPKAARDFAHQVKDKSKDSEPLMIIRAPKGSKALYVYDYSFHKHEQEVLLNRNTKLKLIRIEKTSNRLRHVYEVVND